MTTMSEYQGIRPCGPPLIDWAGALWRGFHPLRVLLCCVGICMTAGLTGMCTANVGNWWHNPAGNVAALAAEIWARSLFRVFLAALIFTTSACLWCAIGGWIARQELLARLAGECDDIATETNHRPIGATGFVGKWWSCLFSCCPMIFMVFSILVAPVLLAGWISGWFRGLGAIGVSLLLPLVFVIDLVLAAMLVGLVAWPLMPVTLAAELTDSYDAVSRSYYYALQRPLRFIGLTALAVALALLPLLVALSWFAGAGQDLPTAGLVLATGLSLSLFWSLETLVYLDLRAVIDHVDPGQIARHPPAASTAKLSIRGAPTQSPAAQSGGWLAAARRLLYAYAVVIGSWYLTIYLLSRASGGPTDWLDRGLTGWSLPSPDGISGPYKLASWIALFWTVILVGSPLVMALRRSCSTRRPREDDEGNAGHP
jgi:hypothetical protein